PPFAHHKKLEAASTFSTPVLCAGCSPGLPAPPCPRTEQPRAARLGGAHLPNVHRVRPPQQEPVRKRHVPMHRREVQEEHEGPLIATRTEPVASCSGNSAWASGGPRERPIHCRLVWVTKVLTPEVRPR